MFSHFGVRYPALAQKQTRGITVVDATLGLKIGRYGFFELFCTETDCDCHRVMISVIGPGEKVYATIGYGWEDMSFYTKWTYGDSEMARDMIGVQLYPLCPQTKYSGILLDIFKEMITEDPKFALRIREHYEMFRNANQPQKSSKKFTLQEGNDSCDFVP
jgi:hypothetical protein